VPLIDSDRLKDELLLIAFRQYTMTVKEIFDLIKRLEREEQKRNDKKRI